MPAPSTEPAISPTASAPSAPVEEVTIDPSIASELPPEALAALKKSKATTKPKPTPAPAATQTPLVEEAPPAPSAETPPTPEDEVTIDLSAEPTAPEETDEDPSITDEELNTLPEDFRKKYRAKDSENLKLRKRSQEAENKLKLLEETKTKLETELTTARATSGSGLEGNVFQSFAHTDSGKVAQWLSAADTIHSQMQRASFLQAKGQEVPEALFKITLPNGKEVEIDLKLAENAAQWESHAATWSQHHKTAAEDQSTATKLASRLEKYDGYKSTYEALKAKPPGREVLLTKAALYDYIVAKGGKITFSGKAAPAQKGAVTDQTPAKVTTSPTRGNAPSAPTGGTSSTTTERARLMKLAQQGDQEALEAALLLPKD